MFYWIEYEGGKKGTVKAKDAPEASVIAYNLNPTVNVLSIKRLPYPASPYLNQIDHPDFCFAPETCKGHSSCPRSYACSE